MFNGVKHIPVEIYTDSKSLYDATKPNKNVAEKDWEFILQYCKNF